MSTKKKSEADSSEPRLAGDRNPSAANTRVRNDMMKS